MEQKALQQELNEYVDLITRIRILSAVRMDGDEGAERYAAHLTRDYREIGELGGRCREILRGTLYPLLKKEGLLDRETVYVLQEFCEQLLEPASGEELDLFLLFEVSERLLKELLALGDEDRYARQLNMHVSVCYANVNRTARVTVTRELTAFYQAEGLKAAEAAKKYLYDKDAFLRLSVEARVFILRACRFYSALYDTFYAAPDTNRARYRALLDALAVAEDPFYREAVPDYSWLLHRCRCMEHMGQLTERGNRWGFTREQCKEICGWLDELTRLRTEEPEEVGRLVPEADYRLLLLRNRHFAGELSADDYRDGLVKLYEKFSNDAYDMHSVQINLLIPAEYLATLKHERISAKTETLLRLLYHRVIDYILRSVNRDAFNYLQEYLTGFLEEFIEIPGVMLFEDMGLNCLAALHPPTYVHSLQVASLSRCLAERLGEHSPAAFFGDYGDTEEEVEKNLPHIVSQIYHSALCHDFGKLTMIDSIFIYGRDLLDREYEIIRLHTLMGAELLSRYSSTKSYAAVARQHHVWYDKKGGYPAPDKEKLSIASEILEVADCIDAATDGIGRSYQKGKTFADVRAELIAGSGTHYAPEVVALLSDPEVADDVNFLLTEGRQEHYRKAYLLLSGVKDRLGA